MTMNGRQFNGYNLNGNIYKFPDGVKDFLDDAFTHATLVKKGKRLLYYNIPASFDIETSSFYAEKSDENIPSMLSRLQCIYGSLVLTGIQSMVVLGMNLECS